MCGSFIQQQFSPVPHRPGQVHHQDPPPGGWGSVGASFRPRPQSRSAVGGRRVMQALRVALRACPASYALGQLGAGAEAPASTGIRFTIVDVRRMVPLPSGCQQSSESVVASTWRRPPGARRLLRSLEARGRSGERRSLPRPPLGGRGHPFPFPPNPSNPQNPWLPLPGGWGLRTGGGWASHLLPPSTIEHPSFVSRFTFHESGWGLSFVSRFTFHVSRPHKPCYDPHFHRRTARGEPLPVALET